MKQRHQELLERSIGAMLAAIEIYNKPVFQYRTESFVILAVNSWELLFKAKMLKDNRNNPRCLWMYETRQNKDGSKKKSRNIKRNLSNNPFTHSLDYLLKHFVNDKLISDAVKDNICLLDEFRDSSVHFYNMSREFQVRIQELGMATLRNYTNLLKTWFDREVGEFNIYMMPLAFVGTPNSMEAIAYSTEEKNFLELINYLEAKHPYQENQTYSVTVNIDVKFCKSKTADALVVQMSNNESAMEVRFSEEDLMRKYPLSYKELTNRCRSRYSDFKVDQNYHSLRKKYGKNPQYGTTRLLDPKNPKGQKKTFYSEAIFTVLDEHYSKKDLN